MLLLVGYLFVNGKKSVNVKPTLKMLTFMVRPTLIDLNPVELKHHP